MWVVYRISDRQVVGSTVDAGVKLFKDQALKDVVDGLIGQPDIKEFDAIEVNDSERLDSVIRSVGEEQARLTDRGDGTLQVEDSAARAATIRVTTNATNFHPVDGVPLLSGDGESFLVVTLEKVSETDDDTSRVSAGGEEKEQDDVIWLRPSHGSIREDTDERSVEIRSIRLEGGTARFRFYSDPVKRLANVQMLSANPNLQLGGLQVEFI
jgi:hypothetical protein